MFVAAILQLGNFLAADASPRGFFACLLVFVPVWWSWSCVTFFANRFLVDDIVHRALIALMMVAIAGLAVSVPEAALADGGARFALAYFMVRVILVLLYLRIARHVPASRRLVRIYGWGFGAAGLLWLASVFVPPPARFFLWAVGMLVDFATPHHRAALTEGSKLPLHFEHLAERYALFTLLVLGETFLKLVLGLSSHELHAANLAAGAGCMAIATLVWWSYFDELAGAPVRMTTASIFGWVYAHVPLTFGLIALAVAMKKIVSMDLVARTPAAVAATAGVAVAACLLATALLELCTLRQDARLLAGRRIAARVTGAAAAGAVSLLAPLLPGSAFVVLIVLAAAIPPAVDVTLGVRS